MCIHTREKTTNKEKNQLRKDYEISHLIGMKHEKHVADLVGRDCEQNDNKS